MLRYVVNAIFAAILVTAMICLVLGFYHLATASEDIKPEKRWLWSGGKGFPLFVPKKNFSTEDGSRHQEKGLIFIGATFVLVLSDMLLMALAGPPLN